MALVELRRGGRALAPGAPRLVVRCDVARLEVPGSGGGVALGLLDGQVLGHGDKGREEALPAVVGERVPVLHAHAEVVKVARQRGARPEGDEGEARGREVGGGGARAGGAPLGRDGEHEGAERERDEQAREAEKDPAVDGVDVAAAHGGGGPQHEEVVGEDRRRLEARDEELREPDERTGPHAERDARAPPLEEEVQERERAEDE